MVKNTLLGMLVFVLLYSVVWATPSVNPVLSRCVHGFESYWNKYHSSKLKNKPINQSDFNAAQGPSKKVMQAGLKAYNCAKSKGVKIKKPLITIIDFSLASIKKRLWVINVDTGQVLINTYVAHGQGSGKLYASYFADISGQHESSLGLYLTGASFYGPDGLSMRINGMEKGFNDKALSRAVVMHSAPYVSERFIQLHHYLGRSWGCPAVPQDEINAIVKDIKNGSLLFIYADNPKWLAQSEYLNCKA